MESSLQRAWQLYRFRRYALALEETVKFLGQYPESAEAFCLAALIHGKEKRQKQALEAAESAIRFMPDWSYPYYVHALAAYWFNKYDLALKSLSEALRIQPTDPDFYELLSAIHAVKGHLNTSLKVAETGLEHHLEHIGCLSRCGSALFELKRMKEAEEIFRQILTIEPEHAFTQGYVGHFLVQQGQYEEALPLLRHALLDNPDWTLAQEAWKEALRTQNPLYGWLARFKHYYLGKRLWLTFLVLLVISFLLSFSFFDISVEGRFSVSVIFAPMLALLGLSLLLFAVGAGMQFTSSMLLFLNRDLRRSTWLNFRQSFTRRLIALLPFIIIGIVLIIIGIVLIYKALSKSGR